MSDEKKNGTTNRSGGTVVSESLKNTGPSNPTPPSNRNGSGSSK